MFTEQQTRIYEYWNGNRNVLADPIRIHRRFYSSPHFDFANDAKMLQVAIQYANNLGKQEEEGSAFSFMRKAAGAGFEAYEKLLESIRYAFEIPPVGRNDAGEIVGLNEDSLMDLLTAFMSWMTEKKNASLKQPSRQNCTAVKS